MKKLYLDCSMGAAGDMLTAALFELIDDKEAFLKQINNIGLDGVKVEAKSSIKCSITGTYIDVSINGEREEVQDIDISHNHKEHCHNSLSDIESIISNLHISQNIKDNALAVYKIITKAESEVHNRTISQIHFHEVGDKDAIADIVSVSMLIDMLGVNTITVSPINVGSGFVHCAHGLLPVPAPATALILQSLPIYSSNIKGELCTPTGAALIKRFANSFGAMPQMILEKTGYGMGKKDFEVPNCVRAFLGSDADNMQANDEIAQLSCNLDDMTGEAISYVMDILFQNGALDVFSSPIYMKKNRPAYMLVCLCQKDKADFFAKLMLKHTTSLGIRKTINQRYILNRSISSIDTDLGSIKIKTAKGYGIQKSKAEYESIAKAALKQDISFNEAEKIINAQIQKNK
ncbi:MAG: nickel pincer cofactor biosynthesis protein LarC [Elusimicrobiota bacterium]|jgi:uncharacterized protein (TIGR00299 family) protein|nr:nickel pincer cofactor biosynthesis protein LarC [Elusimicrobiota bacterium]